jgi:pimeloyl-ACP methyl ester carboxylesterase
MLLMFILFIQCLYFFMNSFSKTFVAFFITISVTISSCSNDNNEPPRVIPGIIENGSGVFNYNYAAGSVSATLKVFYHIPDNVTQNARLLFVFHGADRNARDYRDALINEANRLKFIVIAPEFSLENYPGGDGYNLGNVFVDGDNPSSATLNEQDKWAYSVIEPLFDNLLMQLGNSSSAYDIFGHSAGGQFAHRYIMFKPQARVNKVVASASGWYAFPDTTISFPYGFYNSPLINGSLTSLFSKNMHIQVGANDNNPNDSGLRRNEQANAQGANRKERAERFYAFSQNAANSRNLPFNWSISVIPAADHDFRPAAINAAAFLYN